MPKLKMIVKMIGFGILRWINDKRQAEAKVKGLIKKKDVILQSH